MNTSLSDGLKVILRVALRIASGAKLIQRPDNNVEIYFNGRPQLISRNEANLALDLLNEVDTKYIKSYGYSQPYSAEALIDLYERLEGILIDRMNSVGHKVAFIKADSTGCGWWRCDEPTRMINQLYGDKIYIESSNVVHYESLLPFDIIIVQRGMFGNDTPAVLAIIERLRQAGKIIVYEVDDDLSGLLLDNNCYYAQNPVEKAAVSWLLKTCDAITTTTEYLKGKLGYPDKTYVIPNSIDISKFKPSERLKGREDFLHILWHGGDSHERDINWLKDALALFVEKKAKLQKKINKEIIVSMLGYFPSFLDPYLKTKFIAKTPETINQLSTIISGEDPKLKIQLKEVVIEGRTGVRYIRGVETKFFHEYLCHLQPDISFCPLLPSHEFNFSKSPIKAIESIVAGAATVVSDINPYSLIPDGCVIKAKTPEEFVKGIEDLVINESKRKQIWETGYQWVKDNYSLEKNVSMWVTFFNSLMDKKVESEKALTSQNSQFISIADNK